MKAKTIIKIALGLVIITALFHWQDIWNWVSAKSWNDLAGDILGFILKWFFLAIFGWLAMTIPHYVEPWLKLTRVNGKRRLKDARRSRGIVSREVRARNDISKGTSKDKIIAYMASLMAKNNSSPRSPQTKSTFGERADNDIHLNF